MRFTLICLVMVAAVANANVVGNDTQNFNPITSGLDFVTVHGSVTLEPGVANFGYFLNDAFNVLPETVDSSGETVSSRDQLLAQDLDFGYGLSRHLEMGINLSYLLAQTTDRNEPGAQFSKTALNEIRLNTKYQFLERAPWGWAGVLSMNLNQVKNNPFLGKDVGPTVNAELVTDRAWDRHLVAFNVGYRFRKTGEAYADSVYSPIPNQSIASLGYSYYSTDYDTKWIAEIYTAKSQVKSEMPESSNLATELLLGAKYDYTPALALHAGGTLKLSDGLFTPDFRLYAGLNYSWAMNPIVTSTPAEPAPVAAPVTKTEVNLYKGYLPQDIEALADVDFDEIAKKHEFKLRDHLEEKDLETDKPPFEIVRLAGLDFPFGSSEIQPKHIPLMQNLIKYLNSKPGVIKVRIEGHTDSIGSDGRNRLRSRGRTESVRKYLVEHGLDPAVKVSVEGYGSARPISDNGNFQGRTQNRRVEVRMLRRIHVEPTRAQP